MGRSSTPVGATWQERCAGRPAPGSHAWDCRGAHLQLPVQPRHRAGCGGDAVTGRAVQAAHAAGAGARRACSSLLPGGGARGWLPPAGLVRWAGLDLLQAAASQPLLALRCPARSGALASGAGGQVLGDRRSAATGVGRGLYGRLGEAASVGSNLRARAGCAACPLAGSFCGSGRPRQQRVLERVGGGRLRTRRHPALEGCPVRELVGATAGGQGLRGGGPCNKLCEPCPVRGEPRGGGRTGWPPGRGPPRGGARGARSRGGASGGRPCARLA